MSNTKISSPDQQYAALVADLFMNYSKSQKPSHQLSWSHYIELLKIDNHLERSFYEKQAIAERWSVPELKRQKDSALFLRLAASKDKDGILRLAQHGQVIEQPAASKSPHPPFFKGGLKYAKLLLPSFVKGGGGGGFNGSWGASTLLFESCILELTSQEVAV